MGGPEDVELDTESPNAARMYDYYLGGAHNLAADRALAERLAAVWPGIYRAARAQRAFIMRAVRFCIEQGVRQFLDLGSGIPTADHVHEVARQVAPDARVAYVDVEPVAVAYSAELLADVPGVSITAADVRDPDTVLGAAAVNSVLDLSAPIGLIAVGIVHFIADADDPDAILARYRSALAPGSHLVLAHGSDDLDDPVVAARVTDAFAMFEGSTTPHTVRSRERVRGFFGDLPLVEPGLVDIDHWRHEPADPSPLGQWVGVARVP